MKIDPASLAFDIDGVVADTMTLFLAIAADYGITGIRYDDITEYDVRQCLEIDNRVLMEIIVKIVGGDYTAALYPVAGAADVLRRMNRRHRPTLFVTARPEAAHMIDWITDSLSVERADIEVVATGSFEDKTEVLQKHRISYFVEDRLETCFMLADAGIRPIVFKQPWNRKPHPFMEVSNWQELESLIAME